MGQQRGHVGLQQDGKRAFSTLSPLWPEVKYGFLILPYRCSVTLLISCNYILDRKCMHTCMNTHTPYPWDKQQFLKDSRTHVHL